MRGISLNSVFLHGLLDDSTSSVRLRDRDGAVETNGAILHSHPHPPRGGGGGGGGGRLGGGDTALAMSQSGG